MIKLLLPCVFGCARLSNHDARNLDLQFADTPLTAKIRTSKHVEVRIWHTSRPNPGVNGQKLRYWLWPEMRAKVLVASVRLDASAWNCSGLCKFLESWIDRQPERQKRREKIQIKEQIHLELMTVSFYAEKTAQCFTQNCTQNKQLVQCTSQEIPYKCFFSFSKMLFHMVVSWQASSHRCTVGEEGKKSSIHTSLTIADARRVGTKWWHRDHIQHFHSSQFTMQFQEKNKKERDLLPFCIPFHPFCEKYCKTSKWKPLNSSSLRLTRIDVIASLGLPWKHGAPKNSNTLIQPALGLAWRGWLFVSIYNPFLWI